jgi:transcriptional regulator ATRX
MFSSLAACMTSTRRHRLLAYPRATLSCPPPPPALPPERTRQASWRVCSHVKLSVTPNCVVQLLEAEEEEGDDDEEEEEEGGEVAANEDLLDEDEVESLASEEDPAEAEERRKKAAAAAAARKKKSGGGGGKRKKEVSDSSEASSDDDDDDDDDDEDEEERDIMGGKKKKGGQLGKQRRKIRKIKDDAELGQATKEVQRQEAERRKWEEELRKNPGNVSYDRGIINPLSESGYHVRIHDDLAGRMKDHQLEGVRFMWLRLMDGRTKGARGGLGSLAALDENDKGAGCILAHNMGLGKTFQVVTLLHTIASNIPPDNIELRRMLVLGPVNTMHNWKAELKRFLPSSGHTAGILEVTVLDEAGKTNEARCEALRVWFNRGGVMCMGYEMYRNLVLGQRVKDKELKKRFDRYLRDPGPGIVIADEGHILRNHKSKVVANPRPHTLRTTP